MSLTYDKKTDSYTCPIHGAVHDNTAWVPCWNGCDDGYFDGYEDDPLWYDECDMETCDVCHGKGGWTVCGQCNLNNPDAEF